MGCEMKIENINALVFHPAAHLHMPRTMTICPEQCCNVSFLPNHTALHNWMSLTDSEDP